jgi:hypothetical protein
MMDSDNHDYNYWITELHGQFGEQEVRERFRAAVASCKVEAIPRTMTVEEWFLKSPQFGHDVLPRFEKYVWFDICRVLGIILSRYDRRRLSRVFTCCECERTHINGMLSVPGVPEHLRMVILKRFAREIDRPPVQPVAPAQLRAPATPAPTVTPTDWERDMEINDFHWELTETPWDNEWPPTV